MKVETAISREPRSDIADVIIDSALQQIQRWIEVCEEFREWEREAIILGSPAPEIATKHKKALAMILKSTRLMVTLACDPESFDSEMYSRLSLLHEQLQHSWKMLYEPATVEESARNEAVLRKFFPE
jgi:hypothetical protein